MSRKPKYAPLKVLSPVHKAFRQLAMALERACEPLGHDARSGHILSYLGSYAPCPVGELQRVMGHKASTLTSMLDRLERDGLIVRSLNPEDRRSFNIDITKEGMETAKSMRKCGDNLENRILSHVNARDVEGFEKVMKAIATETEATPCGDSADKKRN